MEPERENETPPSVDALDGDTGKGQDLNEKLKRYAGAHKRTLDMADYIRDHSDRQDAGHIAFSLEQCGSYLLFRNYYEKGEIRLHSASFCGRHMLCPLCAIRRGGKAIQAYMERLEVILQDDPTLKPFLVTLTVKDGEDLEERFTHLHKSVRTYHRQRLEARKGRRVPVEANKAEGAVWSYEFKKGNGSGLWHPHMHAIWLCHDAPDAVALSREWHEITGDSFIVDVTPFHDQQDVVKGFMEVFKYAVKFSDLPLDQNYHGWVTLKGRRLISSMGCFYGVKIPEKLTDDALENEPYSVMFYRYMNGTYQLRPVPGTEDIPF